MKGYVAKVGMTPPQSRPSPTLAPPATEDLISGKALACILISIGILLIVGGFAWRYLLHKYLGWYS